MIVTIPEGQSKAVTLSATDAIWVITTGICRVTDGVTIDEYIGSAPEETRIGYYGEAVKLTVFAIKGTAAYSDEQTQLLKLTAEQKGDEADSSPVDVANTVNLIIDRLGKESYPLSLSVESLTELPDLPAVDTVYDVIGFYAGTTTGGGQFVYLPSQSKSTHNGGTIIAPEAIAAWDGTQANLASLLNWTGSGSGCWVRLAGTLPISPLEFGAINGTVTDSTLALSKCIQYVDTFIGKGSIFRITSRITVPSGRFITGDGTGAVQMDGTGFNGTSTLYAANSLGFLISGATSGRMSGFSIALTNQTDELVAGAIAVRSSSNVTISDMNIYGFRKSKIIAADSCVNCSISANKISDSLLSSATNGQLTAIDIDNNRVGGISSENIEINDNEILNLTCSPAFLSAFGNQTDGINVSYEDSSSHTIKRNKIVNVGEGIDCFGKDCSITNNYIEDAYNFGIKLIHGARNNLVSVNVIQHPGLAGIVITGSNADANHTEINTVSNNFISDVNKYGNWDASTSSGIRLDSDGGSKYARNNKVKNNSITLGSKMKYGILLDVGSQNNLVQENTVDSFTIAERVDSGAGNNFLRGVWYTQDAVWTPFFKGSTTDGSFSYSERQARYVRVGDMVTIWCRIIVSSVGAAATGELEVGGLPVNTKAAGGLIYSASLAQYNKIPLSTGSGYSQLTVRLLNNSSKIAVIQCGNNVEAIPVDSSVISAGTAIVFSCTYLVGN